MVEFHRRYSPADWIVFHVNSFDCDSLSGARYPRSRDIATIPALKYPRYWCKTVAVSFVGSRVLIDWLFRRFQGVARVTGSLYAVRKGNSGLAGVLSETGELCVWHEGCRTPPRPAPRSRRRWAAEQSEAWCWLEASTLRGCGRACRSSVNNDEARPGALRANIDATQRERG